MFDMEHALSAVLQNKYPKNLLNTLQWILHFFKPKIKYADGNNLIWFGDR